MNHTASILLASLSLVGCGAKTDAPETALNVCAEAPSGAMTVVNAWVRPAAAGGATALYASFCNKTGAADALVSVGGPASSVELHSTSRSADGVVSMAPIKRLDLPANGSAALEPGGAHVMLIGVTDAIEEGEPLRARFTFEKAPPVEIEAVAMRDEPEAHEGH
jgi:copper(I)-binding protein